MRSRDGGLFDSYDFFGKAIPGVVWLFGIVLLLPKSFLPAESPTDLTIRNIALILIAGVAVGLVFGEGIHNVAVNIESAFGWGRRWFMRLREAISSHRPYPILFMRDVIFDSDEGEEEKSDEDLTPQMDDTPAIKRDESGGNVQSRLREWWAETQSNWASDLDANWVFPIVLSHAIKNWLKRRMKEVDTGLISHRDLFLRELENQVIPYRRTTKRKETKYELFIDAVEDDLGSLNINLEREEGRLNELYPVITTRLDEGESTRAGSFQSRYSFCRSMWVVLGILTLTYTSVFAYRYEESLARMVETSPGDIASFVAGTLLVKVLLSFSLILLLGITLEAGILVFRPNWRNYTSASVVAAAFYLLGTILVVAFGTPLILRLVKVVVASLVPPLLYLIHVAAQMTVIYAVVFNYGINAENLLLFKLLGDVVGPFLALLTISTIAFFDASGDYKEYYVEYLVTEYSDKVGSLELEGGSDEPKSDKTARPVDGDSDTNPSRSS